MRNPTSPTRFALSVLSLCCLPLLEQTSAQTIASGPKATSGVQNLAPLGIDWRQAANDDASACDNDPGGSNVGDVHWIGSILQSGNSIYLEGMGVPERVIFTNIPATANNLHTLNFKVQSTKANVHAYDFLISWQQALDAANVIAPGENLLQQLFVNRCLCELGPQGSTAICDALHASGFSSLAPLPVPGPVGGPNCTTTPDVVATRVTAFETLFPTGRTAQIFGNAAFTAPATCTFLGYDQACNDTYALYQMTWTSASDSIAIEWAGHLAKSGSQGCPGSDPGAYAPGFGSSDINGGPYHFKLELLDGGTLGNQDNQIQGADIRIPGPQACSISPGDATVCQNAQPVNFTVTSVPLCVPGITYAWAFTNNTSGATFCSATNLATVCVNPGPNAGSFTLQSTIANTTGSVVCSVIYTIAANTTASALTPATICEGLTNQFCTTAGGTGPFTFSWTRNGASISGATSSCYTATAGAGGSVDTYCVTVNGLCGSAPQCATLTANTNNTATPLTPATICEGLTNQFCTTAGGTGPFTFSWTRNGASISGATSSCYTATAGAGGSVDTYCVTVDGACGTPVQQCATLTANTNNTATPLSPATICEGLTNQFCTTPGGTGPFTFSWTRNGASISGATSSCYTATAGAGGSVDTYCVTVDGACGAPAQQCATLTANFNNTATPLTPATICEGLTNQFCTTPGGTGPFTFSWTRNGASISGATDNCYTATAGAGGSVDTYCVTVDGACGTPAQQCATLTANSNNTATPLSPATACEGLTNQFCTTAGGTGPFTFSWTRNGASISGATSSCYTATAGAGGTVDTYCVTVDGACGTPAQQCATLTATTNNTATPLTPATICEGLTNQFCTTPGGTGPFTFSWTRNGASISGATSSCYTATAGAGGSVDTYCVTVDGACGAPAQQCATLTANFNNTATPLTPATICEGLTNQFCTTAGGTGPFTFSWTRNGASISGATSSCYTATAGAGGSVDTYCVTVDGACGTPVQQCATLTANTNNTASPLTPATVCQGQTNQFCTTAGGTGPFTFSWTRNGASISGATDNCYTATAGAGGSVDTYCVTVDGACGTPAQQCATLTATTNNTATPLTPATICEGLTNQFCTTPGGTGPFTFSWTRNGASISGATSSCYTATAGAGGSVDTYCVTVDGACGAPAQQCATLTANFNNTATPLTPATICEGLTNQFCTTAGGTGPFTFSWTRNGASISGATSSCYTATAGAGGSVDTYCVTVDGACGAPAQQCATLTANFNNTATPLTPATICEGLTNQFCTTPGGTGPFTFSWTRNGASISGATSSCYTATAGAGGSVDTYCVTVDGACGAPAQQCATLTANFNNTATPLTPATICEGLTNQFCTTAGGTGPFTFSWTRNGASISGATSSCYTATAGAGGSVDTYCVTVDGACGTPVQQCATLTANTNNTASPLTPATVCQGLTNQFCTTAGGTGPFTFSWTKNGNSISGATSSCYTATASAGGTVDTYCVTVDGACGTPVQQCATLTANTNVSTTDIPDDHGCPGDTLTFCTTASGTGPFGYQWSRNGANVPGATDSCFSFDIAGGDTEVCVTVTGACGPPAQQCATLTVDSCGGAHCTLTQGAYGNPNGRFNGIRRQALILQLLQGGMTVGVSGTRSLSFAATAHDAACIIQRLPGNSTAGALPDFGDETLESDCQTSPIIIPVNSQGHFENVLLGQVITLSLNLRLSGGITAPNGCVTDDTDLGSQELCHTMVSIKMLPGPDGCLGTADDVPDLNGPDGDPTTPDNLKTETIDQTVLDSLGGAGEPPSTVNGLLELGNRALAGLSTGSASVSNVNSAVDAINNLFDGCRGLVDCTK